MSESKHTPGPWGHEDTAQQGMRFVVTAPHLYSDRHLLHVAREIESEADARLIAAAPDMKDALAPFGEHSTMRAVDMPEWRDHDTVQIVVTIGQLRAARAAIAKAEGRSDA